jgi:hypothetical protein
MAKNIKIARSVAYDSKTNHLTAILTFLLLAFSEKSLFSTTSNYMKKQENDNETMQSDKNNDYLQYFSRYKESTKRCNATRFKEFCS